MVAQEVFQALDMYLEFLWAISDEYSDGAAGDALERGIVLKNIHGLWTQGRANMYTRNDFRARMVVVGSRSAGVP